MQDVQAGILVNPVFVYSPADTSKVGIPPLSVRDTHLRKETHLNVKPVSDRKPASGRPSQSAEVEETKEEQTGVVLKAADLNYSQKAINFLFQFLNQLCMLDDKITAKQILKND